MKHLFLFTLILPSLPITAQINPDRAEEADSLEAALSPMIDMQDYSIDLPNTWKISPGCLEMQCTGVSPTDTIGGYDTYLESINLTINKLSSASYTAQKYANYSAGYLPKVVSQFRVLDKTKLSASSYRLTYTGVKNNLRQVWRQYYHVKNAQVYIVTFSAEQKKYRFYKDMIEPYLASFKFK
ncbi:MAG: hypothetical protein ACI9DJ_002659 [Algoriphagus sp.]|jgi:hypothetical protein